MKKLMCLFLCLLVIASLVGCSQTETSSGKTPTQNQVTEKTDDSTEDVTEPMTEPAPKGEATFSLSEHHTAYLDENGNLYVWGSNSQYQLGYGGTKEKPDPYCIMTDVSKVYAMPFITAALKTNGDLYTMGMNARGQAGCGDLKNASEPQLILSGVKDFVHNGNNGAAIMADGSLYVWGSDGFTKTPEKVLDNVKTLHMDDYSMGVITDDGTLYAWSSDGAANVSDASEISMKDYKVMDHVVDVYMSYRNLVVVKEDGALYSKEGDKLVENVAQVSLYRDNMLIIDDRGDVFAKGDFGYEVSYREVTKIFEGAKSVCAGDGFAMLVAQNGDLYSWGNNRSGQLGNGTTEQVLVPTKILENVAQVYIPYEDSTAAALTVDGSVYTWGSELSGMLGYETGSELSCCVVPTKVLDNVNKLWFGAWPYGGNSAVAAICKDGSLYTWGYNTDGEIGNGTDDQQITPYLLELD